MYSIAELDFFIKSQIYVVMNSIPKFKETGKIVQRYQIIDSVYIIIETLKGDRSGYFINSIDSITPRDIQYKRIMKSNMWRLCTQ